MSEINEQAINAGDEVVRAVGELSATVNDVANAAAQSGVDHEEVQGWLTTIFKAIMDVIK